MRDIYSAASELRQRHHGADGRVTVTHVPSALDPARVLALLRGSSLESVVAEDGERLTFHTSLPGYGPLRATDAALVDVWVTASVWEPPHWDFTSAELVVTPAYRHESLRAQQRLSLSASDQRTSLTRVFYDEQRAGTGYDGGRRVSVDPSDVQVHDFLRVVRSMTGED